MPRSSSLTKLFDSPVIDEKNIIIHKIPEEMDSLMVSDANANIRIATAVRMNRNTAESEYLVLNSLFMSFARTESIFDKFSSIFYYIRYLMPAISDNC